MKALKIVRSSVWIWVLSAVAMGADPVDEAYRSIPHQRTVFRVHEALGHKMQEGEARFLEKFFALVDSAVVLRVSAMKANSPAIDGSYEGLLRNLDALSPPSNLVNVKNLVSKATADQAKYFKVLRSAGAKDAQALIQSSSQALHQAYSELMRIYPEQSATNKQAFFDYLCALDFV